MMERSNILNKKLEMLNVEAGELEKTSAENVMMLLAEGEL
jgi:hypothetical protein